MAKPLTREERELATWGLTPGSSDVRWEATVRTAESRVEELEEFVRHLDCNCDGAPDGPGRCGRCLLLGECA